MHPSIATRDAADNPEYGSIEQDDYYTWVGETALMHWGAGKYADRGSIRYNQHAQSANHIYFDGHFESLRWINARFSQFPDHRVRRPLPNPPQ